MFEGIVADLLNKYLGKYVQNLDTENLNIGILDGSVELTDLQLKPEALFELNLPIEVKAGYIGKISLIIPWTSLYSLPVVASVEDVYLLAGPIADRAYDAKKEQALQIAIKKKTIEALEAAAMPDAEAASVEEKGFFAKLTDTIINNIHISVQRIHLRYEDKISNPEHPFACGVMMKSLTVETKDRSWQPAQIDADATQINKLLDIQGFSIYWNPYLPENNLVRNKLHTTAWRNVLKNSLDTHRIMDEEFHFMIPPVSPQAKVILNKGDTSTVPKLLASVSLPSIAVLLSRQQYLNMISLADSFKMMSINQRHRKWRPTAPVKGHASEWWHYAYTAVAEEDIRPFSWQRIKQHRDLYRKYKNAYKRYLEFPDNKNLEPQLLELEMKMDVANILMAREQARMEFAAEAPERVEKKKEEKSWWDRLWYGEDEEEIIITRPENQTSILGQLSEEEKERLYRAIRYDVNENADKSQGYVAHKVDFAVDTCSLSLVNYSKEVVKLSVGSMMASLENRPDTDSFKLTSKTESFVIEGVSIEHDLVPIITSDIGVYAPSVSQVFSLDFELNPHHVEADLAVRLTVQPIEIIYDEHAVTEVMAFFQVPQVTKDDVMSVVSAGWSKVAEISRAGLQYAIEQHKTMHLSVNMRSPYVVIPEYGTLHRGGNVFVVDFGKLKVESDLQPKAVSLNECTMSEIESRLYDKFNITVSEVKVLLADSGEDWHTAQTQPDSPYHILPSVGLQLAFFNSVKADFKELPQQKLEAKISTLKLHLSDQKLQMLFDFLQHIPIPQSSSMMGLDDSIDGNLDPFLYTLEMRSQPRSSVSTTTDSTMEGASAPTRPRVTNRQFSLTPSQMDAREMRPDPTMIDLRRMRRAVRMNSAHPDMVDGKRKKIVHRSSLLSIESDHYYSASDHSDDDMEEWANENRPFEIPMSVDDNTSRTNTIRILCRFTLGEVVILVAKNSDQTEIPYLMMRVNRLCVEAAMTSYGIVAQARLGSLQLVDKIHTGSSGEYLEILSNHGDTDVISVEYRKVGTDCPDFDTVYRGIEQRLLVHFSNLKVVFNRAAMLYLNTYLQGLLMGIKSPVDTEMKRSCSTILSEMMADLPSEGSQRTSLASSLFPKSDQAEGPTHPGLVKFHFRVDLSTLTLKLCNQDSDFADIHIKGFVSRVILKPMYTMIQARMTDMAIDDLTENTLYPRVLTIEDDSVFDVKYIKYAKPTPTFGVHLPKADRVDSSFKLRVGRIHVTILYMFISEVKNFMDPFINPDTYEAYKVSAQRAVHNTIADVQEQGSRVSLNMGLRAPTLILPQNSQSTNLILIKLGDLSLKNYFEETEVATNIKQNWDRMFFGLDSMEMLRGKLSLNGNLECAHTIVNPINIQLDVRRALPPIQSDLGYEINGKVHTLQTQLTQQDIKVLMSVLRENFQEQAPLQSRKDDMDYFGLDRIASAGDTMLTPVVEIEQPLLEAPEVSELAKRTQFDFVIDGMVLTLLSEDDEDSLVSESGGSDEQEGICRLEMGQIDIGATLSEDTSMAVKISLVSVIMEDIRPHSNLAIKRVIQSSGMSSCAVSIPRLDPMVSLEYKKGPEGNQHINMTAETVRVNVCVPYLLLITNFFMNSLREQEHSMKPPNHDSTPTEEQSPGPPAPEPVAKTLTVSGRFRQPEIILFADPTNKNSRVLVMKTNVAFDYFHHEEREHLEAKVRQLEIVSCLYGRTLETAAVVLCPCDIELQKTTASVASPVAIEIKVSDIFLYLSSSTLNIGLEVLNIIRADLATPADTDDPGNNYPPVHHDLWTTKAISSESWLTPEPDSDSDRYPIIPTAQPTEKLRVEMKKVQVMFEVENLDFHVPRLCVKLAVKGEIQDWSTQLRVACELDLEMCFFNDSLASWEPLLEPVMETEGHYRPWHLIVKLVRASSHPMTSTTAENAIDKEDDLDGDVHYLMSWSRQHSDSSQTDSDSDTEMTIIKPKLNRKTRHMTDKSYECIGGPGNVQGESDSEPDAYISTLASKLDLLSSDSSDVEASETEDDPHPSEKPVFLTAKGPIHVDTEGGEDEPDGLLDDLPLCNYIAISSFDVLNVNLTPKGMDVITEVVETLTGSSDSILPSIRDLPGFEAFNKLDSKVRVHVPKELQSKVYEENLHNVELGDGHEKLIHMAVARSRSNDAMLNNHNFGDGVDGLAFLTTSVAGTVCGLIEPSHSIFRTADEENHNQNAGNSVEHGKLSLEVDEFEAVEDLSIKKAMKKLVPLAPSKNSTKYCIVYDLDVCHGRKVLTLRSPLQVFNHLGVEIRIFCRSEELVSSGATSPTPTNGEYTELRVMAPEESWDVPLYVAYHCQLFFTPAGQGFKVTKDALWWRDLPTNNRENMRAFSCDPMIPGDNSFNFKVVWKEGAAVKPLCGMPSHVPHYSIHLQAPTVLHNWLPYNLQVTVMGEQPEVINLKQGEHIPVYTAPLTQLQIQVFDYLSLDWTGTAEISSSSEEFKAISMETSVVKESANHQLSLSIHTKQTDAMNVYVYTPYWIVNKTGLPIQIRGSRSEAVYENGALADPLLFRFKKYRRKKAKLRVYNSKWSHSFSLDTVGNSGVVICKDRERNTKFQLLVDISLSSLKLTKIVTILPQFMVMNNTPQTVRYMEENEENDLWLNIGPQQACPFWPMTDSMRMFVRYETSDHCSIHFNINENHRTVLRMDNGTALVGEVTGGTDTPFSITFSPYEHGDAPVKVLNFCEDVFIKLHQKNQSQVSLLSPNQSVLYTWDDPTAERTLMWNVYNRKKPSYPAFILKDGSGEEPLSIQTVRRSSMLAAMGSSQDRGDGGAASNIPVESSEDDETEEETDVVIPVKEKYPLLLVGSATPDTKVLTTRTDKVVVYWVSYMEGLQRVLLLTQDPRIAKRANKEIEVEQTEMEVFMSLNGMGVSLINGLAEEVAYISLSSAPSMWEVEVKSKWKILNMERASWLEEKWLQGEDQVAMDNFLQADLKTMEMQKPFQGQLRRRYSPAIWLQYQQSETQYYVQTRFHRLQIDNQLSDSYFPTVLYPTPAPNYVAARSGTRPFVETAIMLKRIPNTNRTTVKFCKVLVQELSVQLDKGFLLSAYDLLASRWEPEQQAVQLQKDLLFTKKSLQELTSVQATNSSSKIVFEYLHLSPLKLHVSFSLDGKAHLSTAQEDSSLTDDLVDFFLSSVGATLTEIKEVELKMAFFEKQGVLLTPTQLLAAVQSHYTSQAIQQAYVLILGLDVLGNPYGLIKDFTQGLGDLFYEPFLGTLHGPDQFMQNLVLGIHSLMGHTVGGLANSASIMTGSLGKALATLSFDEDYKRRRRQQMIQRPKHLPESLYLASKSFVMGVVLGISGIIVSPVKGACEEGVEGFFKGMGKGLMGVLTKPAGGAIDMVSMAFDGLRRAAEMGDEVIMRQRLPRFIDAKKGVKPYSPYQSAGMRLLNIIGKGRFAGSDTYVAHAALSRDDHPRVALVSDKHVFLLEKSRCWSQWDLMWNVEVSDIFARPQIRNNMLVFRVRRDEGRVSVMTGDEHVIVCEDGEVLTWLQQKIEQAMAAQVQGQ